VQRFVKTGSAARRRRLRAEADGLQALRLAGLRVPQVVSQGVDGERAFLVLEYLELQSKGDSPRWANARRGASPHRAALRLGIGTTISARRRSRTAGARLSEFWRDRRLRPQLEHCPQDGFDLEEKKSLELLAGHQPLPPAARRPVARKRGIHAWRPGGS